jgi:ribosomal protein L11 methyltransferase
VDKHSWLEVSFLLPGEQAESVAEILNRYAHQGVVIERDLQSPNSNQMKVYAYLLEDDSLEHCKQEIEKAIFYLNKILPVPAPTYRPIRDQDWMAAWRQFYKPVEIGERLIIIPAWYDAQNTDKSRLPIRINPGMAFGTGTHPTTQLSLQLMEKYVPAGDRMIDIGCGSGVLSIAGILLGAVHSIGMDVSGAAILSSQENAALNEVGDDLEIEKGSVPEILAGTFSYQKAPLVVANILLKVLEELFDQGMGELVEEQGTLLISGILVDQIETIQQKARANGFIPLEQIAQDDWAAIALKKQS